MSPCCRVAKRLAALPPSDAMKSNLVSGDEQLITILALGFPRTIDVVLQSIARQRGSRRDEDCACARWP